MRIIKTFFTLLLFLSFCNDKIQAQSFNEKNHNYEILLIYIGSGSCPACNDERIPVYIKNIYTSLANYSDEIRVIGIAINQDIVSGTEHLSAVFNDFDEISISEDIYGIGSLRFLHEKFIGRAFVPQVLISIRELKKKDENALPSDKYFKNETLLFRKLGLRDIKNFSSVVTDLNITALLKE